jgi:hypothetical protein
LGGGNDADRLQPEALEEGVTVLDAGFAAVEDVEKFAFAQGDGDVDGLALGVGEEDHVAAG